MADLIEDWLNNQVKLSKTISNIEEDFSNGYLFGELLNKFNQINHFNEYKNKEDSPIKVANFKLLEKAFRDMDIRIEKGRIFDLINKKRGVATRFLYLIKKTLAEKFINLENIDLKKSALIHETYNNAMYHATRDKTMIEASKENQTIQSLDLHTLKSNKPKLLSIKDPKFKFEKYKKDQDDKIFNEDKKQTEFLKGEQDKNGSLIRSLESNLHNHRKENDLEQLDQWRKNMEVKKSFELRLHNELYSEANFFKQLVFESIGNSQKEEKMQIENFEKNLSKLGLDVSNAELKMKKSNKAAVSGEIVLQKIREKIEANSVAKKERDRRKRKILIEQKKAQEELLKAEKKHLNNAYETTKNTGAIGIRVAVEEVEAKISEFRAWKELHAIDKQNETERRKETETLEKEKHKNFEEIFAEYSSQREKKKSFNKQEFIKQVYSEDRMHKQKEMEALFAKRAKNLIPVKKITEQILKITEEVFKFQTEFNIELIEDSYWKELMKCFLNDTALSEHSGVQQGANKPSLESYFDAPQVHLQVNLDKNSENADNVSRSKINESQQDISLNNYNNNNNIGSGGGSLSNNKNSKNLNNFGVLIEGVFEECEMFDYLNFIGQYKTNNIVPTNMLNKMLDLFEIMGNDMQILLGNGSNYGKITDAIKEYEPTDDDIENLTIPATYVKNYNLNDIINILIDIKFVTGNNNLDPFNIQVIATQNNIIAPNSNCNNNNIINNNFLGNVNLNVNNNNNLLNFTSNSGTFNNTNNFNNKNNNNYLSVNTIHRGNLQSSHNNAENLNNVINNNDNQIKENSNTNKNSISNIFQNIPIKVLFLGKKFSGRKTQIKSLCESFPIKFYNVEELITKNIQLMEEFEIPFEENPKYKNLKKNELEKAQSDRTQEEAKFEALKPFVGPLKECRDKTLKTPDDLVFEFLFEIIKTDFPKKSHQQIIEELSQKHKKKKELLDELAKIKEDKNAKVAAAAKNPGTKNETFYINEIQKLNVDTNKGFVLLDFPGSLEQAKFFEYKINSFVSETQRPKNFISQLKENFGFILDKIPKPMPNRALSQGAFDLVFYLDVANEEAIRRTKNRKIDPNTGIVYHLEDNPPPIEDKKLNERLIPYEENINFEPLTDANRKLDKEVDALLEFYEDFGFQKANFKSLHKFPFNFGHNAINNNENLNNKNLITERSERTGMTIDNKQANVNSNTNNNNNNSKKDLKEQLLTINSEMKEIFLHLIKINEESESEILASATQHSKEINNTNQINFEKQSFANTTNSQLNHNQNHTNLNLIATNNTNLLNNNNNPSRRNSISNQSNQNANNQKDLQKSKEALSSNLNNNNNQRTQSNLRLNTEADPSNNFNSKNNFNNILLPKGSNLTQNNIQNLDEDDFNKYHKKLEEAKRKLAGLTVEGIFTQWAKMHEQYVYGVKNFLKNLRKQKENIISTYNRMQEKFVDFLRRPSQKMQDINKFQKKYNKFFDEYPQLHGDEQVKAEFHQDISDLSDRIWEVIEERKSEAIAERRKIMESGYVDKEMEKFYFNLEKLYVLEVEKFVTNVNTIREFYWGMDLKYTNTLENLGFSPLELLKDADLLGLPIHTDELGETRGSGNALVNDKAEKLAGSRRSQGAKVNSADYSDNKINKDVTNNNSEFKYPRVEKLFKNSIKLILKLDESLKSMDKMSKGTAMNNISSESSIRKMSRIHLRRNHESTFVDDKREIFIYEEELKNSLRFEKNKFKYRVTFLKFWAIDYFENLRKISKLVYDKLDDWIISTIKAENDAMNNLVSIFDGCIEKEMRLRVDFEMDSFDIYKLIDINDRIEILANELPFRELSEKTCIDYDVFLKVFDEIKEYQISKNYIRTQTFVDLVVKKYLIDNNGLGLPNIFKHLSFYNVKKFLTLMENVPYYQNQSLDKNSNFNDVINVRETFSLLLVFESKLMTEAHEKMLISQAADYLEKKDYLHKESFLNIEFWFERDPNVNVKSADDEFIIPSRLKESLFEINKEDNGLINFTHLIDILSLKTLARPINFEELRKLNKSYGEVLLL